MCLKYKKAKKLTEYLHKALKGFGARGTCETHFRVMTDFN